MTGCQKDQDVVTLKAVIEQDTKAYFGDNDHLPYWDGSDRVNVNGTSYDLDATSISSTFATISNVTISSNNVYCAIFPASACKAMGTPYASGTQATVYFEPNQKYTKVNVNNNSFQRLEMPMGAVATGTTLIFKNLSSILRVNVTNSIDANHPINVKRLTVQAFGVYLAGHADVTLSSGEPAITMSRPQAASDDNVISLYNATNYQQGMESIASGTSNSKYFDIVVPPFTNARYLIIEVEYTKNDGTCHYTSDTVRTPGQVYFDTIIGYDRDGQPVIEHVPGSASSISVARNKIITTDIDVSTNNHITANYAYLERGTAFNAHMHQLMDGNSAITSIKFNRSELPAVPNPLPSTWKEVQAASSPYKIYAYIEGGNTVTINSEAPLIYADPDCSHMFQGLTNLVSVYWNNDPIEGEGGLQTEDVTDMSYMFAGCPNLTTLSGLEHCNTTNVTNMEHMFDGSGVQGSDLSLALAQFNTHNLENMAFMFNGCQRLGTLDLSGFSTERVTRMEYLCNDCPHLTTLNLSSFTTTQITDMTNMFNGCLNMTNLYLNNFDMSNVSNANKLNMFKDMANAKTAENHCTVYCPDDVKTAITAHDENNYYYSGLDATTSTYPYGNYYSYTYYGAQGERLEGTKIVFAEPPSE